MRPAVWRVGIALTALSSSTSALAATHPVAAPLICSKGDKNQTFRALVTMPDEVPQGSTFTVRIDGMSSGQISHGGLHYIHDMTTGFKLPDGTTYVEGSARVLPDTGTPNVRDGAKVIRDENGLRLALPSRVQNNSSFTPPSIEFELRADAPPGTPLKMQFFHYEVKANAFMVGDVRSACDPQPKPYTIGETRVAGRASL